MKRFVLNGNERTDGCFTAAFFQTQRASFSGRCGAVAAQRLALEMEHEITYLLARTSRKTTARPPVFVSRSYQVPTSWIQTSRFLTVRD
jgi:hypothetical protein